MKRRVLPLLLTTILATTACHRVDGNCSFHSRVPAVVEMARSYRFVFLRDGIEMSARIEDIDKCAGWVRVRRNDSFAVSWVNLADVEQIVPID